MNEKLNEIIDQLIDVEIKQRELVAHSNRLREMIGLQHNRAVETVVNNLLVEQTTPRRGRRPKSAPVEVTAEGAVPITNGRGPRKQHAARTATTGRRKWTQAMRDAAALRMKAHHAKRKQQQAAATGGRRGRKSANA